MFKKRFSAFSIDWYSRHFRHFSDFPKLNYTWDLEKKKRRKKRKEGEIKKKIFISKIHYFYLKKNIFILKLFEKKLIYGSERSESCDTDIVSEEVSDTSGDVANCN